MQISVPFTKLRRIIHLADIHIRLFKRHAEYKRCFATLYSDLQKTDLTDSVIVVAGDLVHAKTDLSPEMVDVASEFLYNLSNLAPTILIAGNHDCFTPDHEVLTDGGWCKIDDVVNGNTKINRIATWNGDSRKIEWHAPIGFVKRSFNGYMRRFVGPNVDLCVTPTHNVVYFHHATKTYYKTEARNVPKTAVLPITPTATTVWDPWSALIGFTKADGTLVIKNTTTGTGRIQFRLKKDRKISFLTNLLRELAIPFTSRCREGVTIICIYGECAKRILGEFSYDVSKPLTNAWYTRHEEHQRGLLHGFFQGDGHHHGKNFYSAVSIDAKSAELITTIARLVGAASHLGELQDNKSGFGNGKPQVPFSVKFDVGESFGSIHEIVDEFYVGDVFCISVPTENLLIRRNGQIVITGNCNLANPNRLDSLTPIVKNLNHPNLYYLKGSGICEIADIDFYVCSIVGEQSEWPVPLDNTRTKIALFHGPVHDAKTDVGYTITNRHVMIETFDGYDMVIMGDIHRHQVLQQYDAPNKKPIIVYSSSLIQQNHGESLHGHGWCDWNVSERSFVFRELQNEHGYYTLEIENGVVPDWSDMPQNVTLRIFAGSLDQTDIKKLVAQIRSKRNVVELSVSNFEGARTVSNTQRVGTFLDIFDENVQSQLIVDYLKEAMPSLAGDAVDRVLVLNKAKNAEIVKDDLARKVLWRPKTLKFSNLFTYGDDNFIDFTALTGVVGIFAPNASGKTSIAEAICFALYDRTPRTMKAANIMNTRSGKCSCEFRFEIDGIEYVVERNGTKNKKGEVKIDVNFYRLEQGVKTSLNGEERRYTNGNIRSYVGDFEDFLLTTFSSSSQQGLFVDRNQADRKDLLTQFMGLNIFDKLHSLADAEIKEVQGALKRFKHEDFTQALVDTQNEIDRLGAAKDCRETELEAVNWTLNKITENIQRLYEQKTPIGAVKSKVELDREAENLRAEYTNTAMTIQAEQDKHDSFEQKLIIARQALVEMGGIDERYRRYQAVESDYRQLTTEYKSVESRIFSLYNELERLRLHEYDAACDFCLKNGQTTIARTSQIEAELPTHEQRRAAIAQQQADLQTALDNGKGLAEQYAKYKAAAMWIHTAELQLVALTRKVAELNVVLLKNDAKRNANAAEQARYTELEDAIKRNTQLDQEIVTLETEKRREKTNFNTLSSAIQRLISEVAVLTQKKTEMLAKIKDAEELETKYEVYEAYLAVVCRDGLPYRLISKVLPTLEVAVNNLLSQMVGFTLVFETDGKNVNMKIRYDDDRVWPLELASGMEKFISSLAIRVALTSVSSLPKSTFLIVDEGLGTLDQDNLASISMLFNVLRTQFEFILLISHVDEVRDVADNLLEIKRDTGFSQIRT